MPYYVVHTDDTMIFDKDPADLLDVIAALAEPLGDGGNQWRGVHMNRRGDALLLEAGESLTIAWTDDESREQLLADLQEHWPDAETGAIDKIVLTTSNTVRHAAHLRLIYATMEVPAEEQAFTVVMCRHWDSKNELPSPWRRLNQDDDSTQVLLSALVAPQ